MGKKRDRVEAEDPVFANETLMAFWLVDVSGLLVGVNDDMSTCEPRHDISSVFFF